MPIRDFDEATMKEIYKLYHKYKNDTDEFLMQLCDIDGNVPLYFESTGAQGYKDGRKVCAATYRLNPRDIVISIHIDNIRRVGENGYLVDVKQ